MKAEPMDGAKKCKKCGVLKPVNSYTHDSLRKDGLTSICRSCYHSSERGRRKMEARIAAMKYET